jgi:hypothetical protein
MILFELTFSNELQLFFWKAMEINFQILCRNALILSFEKQNLNKYSTESAQNLHGKK